MSDSLAIKMYVYPVIFTLLLFGLSGCIDHGLTIKDRDMQEIEENVFIEDDNIISEPKLAGSVLTPYKAPELLGLTNWVHGEPITALEDLRGKVVLIDFWTYSCINCIRTLPHVQALHEKYAQQGLVIIGVHAPEFSYERKIENVKNAIEKHGLTYAIVQDNDFMTWRNYKNRYWPAQYLIDKKGFIRATHFGEGAYAETDRNVALLLEE